MEKEWTEIPPKKSGHYAFWGRKKGSNDLNKMHVIRVEEFNFSVMRYLEGSFFHVDEYEGVFNTINLPSPPDTIPTLIVDLIENDPYWQKHGGNEYKKLLTFKEPIEYQQVWQYARNKKYWGYNPAGYGGSVYLSNEDGDLIKSMSAFNNKGERSKYWIYTRFNNCD